MIHLLSQILVTFKWVMEKAFSSIITQRQLCIAAPRSHEIGYSMIILTEWSYKSIFSPTTCVSIQIPKESMYTLWIANYTIQKVTTLLPWKLSPQQLTDKQRTNQIEAIFRYPHRIVVGGQGKLTLIKTAMGRKNI